MWLEGSLSFSKSIWVLPRIRPTYLIQKTIWYASFAIRSMWILQFFQNHCYLWCYVILWWNTVAERYQIKKVSPIPALSKSFWNKFIGALGSKTHEPTWNYQFLMKNDAIWSSISTSNDCSILYSCSTTKILIKNGTLIQDLSNGTINKFVAQVFPKNARANVKVCSLPV